MPDGGGTITIGAKACTEPITVMWRMQCSVAAGSSCGSWLTINSPSLSSRSSSSLYPDCAAARGEGVTARGEGVTARGEGVTARGEGEATSLAAAAPTRPTARAQGEGRAAHQQRGESGLLLLQLQIRQDRGALGV